MENVAAHSGESNYRYMNVAAHSGESNYRYINASVF
jgi:hypothetical protein